MEKWKDVKGYDGKYQVSNKGRVRSFAHSGRPGKILSAQNNGTGYLFVPLYKNGKSNTKYIHTLVAEAFVDNPDNLPQVNHNDENKENNCADNLEWCTPSYNINYGTRNQRCAQTQGTKVAQLTLDGELIRIWDSYQQTEQAGFNHRDVWACCVGRYRQHKGYIWRKADELELKGR